MRAMVLSAVVLITACSAETNSNQAVAEPVAPPAKGWVYSTSKDKMTDRIYRQARLESIDMLPVNEPYAASPLTMSIYDDGSVFLSADQQFECYRDSCSINARFDGGDLMRIEANELNLDPPSLALEDSYDDNPFGYARLQDFLALTKTSKRVLIEVPIFRQGGQVATFDLSGFDEEKLYGTGSFAVQLAVFSLPADATALRDRVRAAGFSAFTESVSTDKGALTRVRVGPVANHAEADALKAQVTAKVGVDGIVRPHP